MSIPLSYKSEFICQHVSIWCNSCYTARHVPKGKITLLMIKLDHMIAMSQITWNKISMKCASFLISIKKPPIILTIRWPHVDISSWFIPVYTYHDLSLGILTMIYPWVYLPWFSPGYTYHDSAQGIWYLPWFSPGYMILTMIQPRVYLPWFIPGYTYHDSAQGIWYLPWFIPGYTYHDLAQGIWYLPWFSPGYMILTMI